MELKTVNVLGTDYELILASEKEMPDLFDGIDGECDESTKQLHVNNYENFKDEERAFGNGPLLVKKNIRHELIHAFLCESGLGENSDWAQNEEMVDWFARQFLKLQKAFEEVDAI